MNGNRSSYGLQTPVPQVVNDAVNGFGGFATFIFNPDAKNQYRLVTSLRRDYYQIPIDPDPRFTRQTRCTRRAACTTPKLEPDGNFTFLVGPHLQPQHTADGFLPFITTTGQTIKAAPTTILSISTVNQNANYVGMQTALIYNFWRNDLQAGVYGFFQHQYTYFDNYFTDGSRTFPPLP